MKYRRRFAAILLAVTMLFPILPLQALAAQFQTPNTNGLCPHHTEHTVECGYAAGSEESPCTHKHTEACFEAVEHCTHQHTDSCFPQPDATEDASGTPLPDANKPICGHQCTEQSGCIVKELRCPHTHDDACGYIPVTGGSPCTYGCTICSGVFDEPDWVQAAREETGAPDLADGMQVAQIYAAPRMPMSAGELADLQAQSASARADENPDLEMTPFEDYMIGIGFVYVNGDIYEEGDLKVTEDDTFSYNFSWNPKFAKDSPYWQEGAWFEVQLFQFPNLTLASTQGKLAISGVRVADWELNYDRDSGKMLYKVVFNEYITFFDPETVMAQLRGSGRFQGELDHAPIKSWDGGGSLTIDARPEIPPTPQEPSGTGWAPAQPPTFNNDRIPFGKGVKWTSGTDSNRDPEIDWRIVFFDLLQEAQEAFLKGDEPETFDESYLIIEDTLDKNQQFYVPNHSSDVNRFAGAPFHLELPVMLAGTDQILNGGIGNAAYDNAGEISTYIPGGDDSVFREITAADIGDTVTQSPGQTTYDAIYAHVRKTPLTWAIVYVKPHTDRQTLIINAGVPGGKDPESSLTWDAVVNDGGWYETGLQNRINDCQTRIDNVENGTDSPIALLDTRKTALMNLLRRVINQPMYSDKMQEMEAAMMAWGEKYDTWRSDEEVNYLGPLQEKTPTGWKLTFTQPMPAVDDLQEMTKWQVNAKGDTLDNTLEYQNYVLSLSNLLRDPNSQEAVSGDQEIYLHNRKNYGDGWRTVKERYEKTLEFYRTYGIYGFTVKVRSSSINTSMRTYENDVRISLDKKVWSAQDSANVDFGTGIMGSFALGSVVLQKADAHYIPDELKEHAYQLNHQQDVVDTIKDIRGNGGTLDGVTFEMYGVPNGTPFDPAIHATEGYQAHFLPTEASENGKTYRFTHVDNAPATSHLEGEIEELKVDNTGELSISHLFDGKALDFYLIEKATPDGYYRDPQPIPVTAESSEVRYHLIPNVSRAVRLTKVDSYSKTPLEGAEFELYQTHDADGQKLAVPQKITGFEKREKSGTQEVGYWTSETKNDPLLTNENGVLCLHGLAPGKYYLQESEAPDGYTIAEPDETYQFTVGYDLPDRSKGTQGTDGDVWEIDGQLYNKDYHILLPSAVENDPKTADLTLTKVDGILPAKTLPGAGFALFRFMGTEAQWDAAGEHDDPANWKMIDLQAAQSTPAGGKKYFQLPAGTQFKQYTPQNGSSFPGEGGNVPLTNDQGQLQITDIPIGHYSIAEVIAPGNIPAEEPYERPYTSMYFQVSAANVSQPIQLYDNPSNHTSANAIERNQVKNYTKLAQLALVKYAEGEGKPAISTAPYNKDPKEEAWQYKPDFTVGGTYTPLPGATYKLFMSMGGNSEPNPDLAEKNSVDFKPVPSTRFDPCLAKGTTGTDGILELSDMKDRHGNPLSGLNMEYYYLIEVEAPDGYLLDQTPITFPLTGDTMPDNPDKNSVPGLIKIDGNRKADYGLQLTKTDAETNVGLDGAVFEVRENGTGDPLWFTGQNGVYRLAAAGEINALPFAASGEGGKLTITGLQKETNYEFTEIAAPQGYHRCDGIRQDGTKCTGGCDAGRTVTIKTPKSTTDGTLTDGVLYPDVPTTVENERLKGRVELVKVSAETREALPGATFELYETVVTEIKPGDPDYDKENPGATRSEDVKRDEATTGADGKLVFENLEWSEEPGYYFLRESKAPDGYALDQTKLMFSIDRYSFDAKGNPIPVLFPAVANSVGKLGRAKLTKADAADGTPLPDAHFYLMKKVKSATNAGKETWIGYGQGLYITDGKGEIHFLLPPGDYKLIEMKAPDGYVIIGMGEIPFTIPEDLPENEIVIIDEGTLEEGTLDGVVTNKKGETGVHIIKTLAGSDIPVPDAVFRLYQEKIEIGPPVSVVEENLNFISRGGGNYEYVEQPTAGSTTELVTNENGELFVMLPASFDGQQLNYEELRAPGGLQFTQDSKGLTGKLYEGIYADVAVENTISQAVDASMSISIEKYAGNTTIPLPDAEFTLYYYAGTEAHEEDAHIEIAKGKTDGQGRLIFKQSDNLFPPLVPGGVYHIVETGAPTGYAVDKTHHEVVLDESCFDKDFNFIPPKLTLHNYQIQGAVKLRKVDADDPGKGLEGAEFELLRKDENAGPFEHWEHYGDWRYRTNGNGELLIEDLPYGAYMLVERTAPLGYLLGDPAPSLSFVITEEENGKTIDLGDVTNPRDPTPHKAVTVRKVAAGNASQGLPGAHFQLYYMRADGEYVLRTDQVYVTDDKGEIHFPVVPAGSYAMNEVKAPEGYLLPENTMTKFAVPREADAPDTVLVQIENKRAGGDSGGGGGGGGTVPEHPGPDPDPQGKDTLTVHKIWVGTDSVARPDSIQAQLYRNGQPYGEPVELSEDNGWKHIWESLDPNDTWSIDEAAVPEGYYKTVRQQGNVWTIYNATTPVDPVDPIDPTDPVDPTDPDNPDAIDPDDTGNSADPGNQDISGQPGTPDHVPQTGDPSQLSLWLWLMGLSAAGFALVWSKRKPYKARHVARRCRHK